MPLAGMHNHTTMSRQSSSSGQILVLVLLVVLVGMSIGLSVASRTLSNLRDTTHLNQSNRAFSAAEAGIEVALGKLNVDPAACQTTEGCFVDSDNNKLQIDGVDSVKVTAKIIGGTTDAFGLQDVKRDDVIQVSLESQDADGNTVKYAGNKLDIFWDTLDSGGACDNSGQHTAAIVVSIIYTDSSGKYGMDKQAYDKCTNAGRQNGFDNSGIDNPPVYPHGTYLVTQDGSHRGNYKFKKTINLPTGVNLKLARIRLMYGDDTEQIAIQPVGGHVLPPQGQEITSTAVAGENQRTVKVVRSNATLPAIFDYALFNGSTNPLTK